MRQSNDGRQSSGGPVLLVGVGASAGGLPALEGLLRAVPPDTNMAFVIVQHLDPTHDSVLAELLGVASAVPVMTAEDGLEVAPDHAYVIPPNQTLTIQGSKLRLSPLEDRSVRAPINRLLVSLAAAWGPRSAAVILSGSGSDGARGVESIKQHGGLVLVQDPATAVHDSMPQHAIATGLVDRVLAVEEMPVVLSEHADRRTRERAGDTDLGDIDEAGDERALDRICAVVRQVVGHDFCGYKRATLVRRIRRRQAMREAASLADYAALLEAEPNEAHALFRQLLIGVTAMFRDPEAFRALAERVLPPLLRHGDPHEPVRVWVPGCSTGEEAYTLAILFREAFEREQVSRSVQIFASDVDEAALEVARRGVYPERVVAQMTPRRRERYFVERDDGCQVRKSLRETCVFSAHNLLRDPPFSRLDLISCRNVLIYLDAALQDRVIPLFHYALRPGGYLLLGPSENVGGHRRLFEPLDKRARIFVRKDAPRTEDLPFALAGVGATRRTERPDPRPAATSSATKLRDAFRRTLIDRYAPPSVVVDDDGRVVHATARTGRYLELPSGTANLQLVDMTRRPLQINVRTALHEARKTNAEVIHRDLVVRLDDGRRQHLDLHVTPLPATEHAARHWLVVFREAGDPQPEQAATEGAHAESALVRELESELRVTKAQLQAAIEELEISNEELRSSNEELLSINEEMQSANEELQTSKEELQSVNEELETVNAELNHKVVALDTANSDITNLLESTDIATLFLDRDRRIKRFTPACRRLFRLIDTDLGRPISDITTRLLDLDLAQLLAEVETGQARTITDLRTADGGVFRARVLPYRRLDGVIDGVVLTFVDVTDLTRARRDAAWLARIIQSSEDAIVGQTREGVISSWNPGAERLFGYAAEQAIGQHIALIVPDDKREELAGLLAAVNRDEHVPALETARVREDGRRIRVSVSMSPVFDADGEFIGISAIDRDIEDRKRYEREIERQRRLLQLIIDAVPVLISYVDTDYRYRMVNLGYVEWFGREREQIEGKTVAELVGPDAFAIARPALARALAGERVEFAAELPYSSGGARYVHAQYVPDVGADGAVRGTVAMVQDVSEAKGYQRRLEDADRRKDEFLAMLAHELRNPLGPIVNGVQLLRENQDADTQARVLEVLERQVFHLRRLVDDLLDVSRISRGKITLEKVTFDVRKIIRDLIEDLRPNAERGARTLTLALPDDEALHVHADPVRLTQMIGNLVANAIKFTSAGGTIDVSVRRDGAEVLIVVRDDGRGIEPELLPGIFDLFAQGHVELARELGGLGIGLTTVSLLVHLHGGSVTAESPGVDQGATFNLRLPIVEPKAASRPESPPEPTHEGSRRVLVVEDEPDAAETLALLLRQWGHDVRISHDGDAALAAVAEQTPELVLLDIGLPGTDGFEVAKRLREMVDGDMAIVMLSGYGQESDRRRSEQVGADGHLTKPASIHALRGLLRDLPQRSVD